MEKDQVVELIAQQIVDPAVVIRVLVVKDQAVCQHLLNQQIPKALRKCRRVTRINVSAAYVILFYLLSKRLMYFAAACREHYFQCFPTRESWTIREAPVSIRYPSVLRTPTIRENCRPNTSRVPTSGRAINGQLESPTSKF